MPDQPKHTPGTMFIKRAGHPVDGAFDCGLCIHFHGRDYVVAETFGRVDVNELTPAEANARRLAACWNAFADIPTVLIEEVANKTSLPMRTAALMAMAFLVGKRAGEAMSEEELDAFERSSINDGASIGEVFKAAYGTPAQPSPLRDDERAEVLKSASSA
jgi:hypothetical protein